jgi:small subunit ribosomal protein S14
MTLSKIEKAWTRLVNDFPISPAPSTFGLYVPSPLSTMNIRVLRDMKARRLVKESEIARRAYLYVARNQTLPPQVRHQAQLQLNSFDKYTRPTTVKNRCAETGRGRGIMSEFAMCRVRRFFYLASRVYTDSWLCFQYQFRLKARAGEIMGVHKASW